MFCVVSFPPTIQGQQSNPAVPRRTLTLASFKCRRKKRSSRNTVFIQSSDTLVQGTKKTSTHLPFKQNDRHRKPCTTPSISGLMDLVPQAAHLADCNGRGTWPEKESRSNINRSHVLKKTRTPIGDCLHTVEKRHKQTPLAERVSHSLYPA